jgi:hypothetical protein
MIQERQQANVALNYIIEVAIQSEVDYLFIINDDGILPADTLEKLLEDDKDIVGAPMLTRNKKDNGEHGLCCFKKDEFYIGDGQTINKYTALKGFDNSKGYLHQVDATGAACILVKKECFTALFQKHNGRPFEDFNGVFTTKEHGTTTSHRSEDTNFCDRATTEGFEIWIDTRIRPIHLGKPEFIRFEQEGENLPPIRFPRFSPALLSESLTPFDPTVSKDL